MAQGKYIYGDKQRLERVLIGVHLMRNIHETNYKLNFMDKWHHHVKSQTDSDYMAHVDYDESWIDSLDDPDQFRDDVSNLTLTDAKPDKFAGENFKETSDGQYQIPESENEDSIMIRRDGLGRPLKDANGNHITNNQEIDTSTIDPLPEEGEWVEETVIYSYDNKLWGCIQGHNRMHYDPSETPALFNEIPNDFSEGYPEWQQPTGAHDAYNTGDIVTLNGVLYKSRIDANTTNPEQYNDTDSPWNYWDEEPFD